MQTFLPYPSFKDSAEVLDYRRLGKQRVECIQLLKALDNPDYGWYNHPAAKMWRGYSSALKLYYNVMVTQWVQRGYNNTLMLYSPEELGDPVYPPWIGDENFHASHRSNLLRKQPGWYSQWSWTEPNDLPYVWPV